MHNENRNSKKRIFIDSQSASLFIGQPQEQAYDGRALALAREGDIIVTTSPIDQEYISYWKNLGFSLPTFMVAGPYQNDKCLSTLILNHEGVQRELQSLNKEDYELHFFGTVMGSEDRVAEALGIAPYVNFVFADTYRNKEKAKHLFMEAGIPTLPYISSSDADFSFEKIVEVLGKGPYLAKDHLGSGGKNLGTIFEFSTEEELNKIPTKNFIVEAKIKLYGEIALDWEITAYGKVHLNTKREQISINDSFCGTRFPVDMEDWFADKLNEEYERFIAVIIKKGGLGHMSCDILIDSDMNTWWSDLNPRKAASHYVCQAVKDLMRIRDVKTPFFFHHQHAHTTRHIGTDFSKISQVITELDSSSSRFVLVTNPNLFEHGTVDITAISFESSVDATNLLNKTFKQVGRIGSLNYEL